MSHDGWSLPRQLRRASQMVTRAASHKTHSRPGYFLEPPVEGAEGAEGAGIEPALVRELLVPILLLDRLNEEFEDS